jgi:ADP-heptose:LPS heptosyltransferase
VSSARPASVPPVLVFSPYCPRSIGEQIVQIPFLSALRERAGGPVTVVAPEESSRVLADLGAADDFVEYPLRAGAGELLALARRLRAARPRAAWQIRKRSIRTSMLAKAATAGPVAGYRGDLTWLFQRESIPFDTTIYLAELYLRLLGTTLAEWDAAQPPREDGGYALIVPVGLAEVKRYPIPQWLEVAAGLAKDRPVKFLIGPGMTEERAAIEGRDYEVHEGPAMPAVRDLVRNASLVLSNDCGPAHFAQLRDVPRVTVFERSVNWVHWFRPTEKAVALRSPQPGAIARISPRELLEAADQVARA